LIIVKILRGMIDVDMNHSARKDDLDVEGTDRPSVLHVSTSPESHRLLVDGTNAANTDSEIGVTLIAKFAKDRIVLDDLTSDTSIFEVKLMLQEKTRILPKRQKLVGLVAQQGGAKSVVDALPLSSLKVKGKSTGNNGEIIHHFILMGTPEEDIFVDPRDHPDLPDVMDDFDLDLDPQQHINQDLLLKFTEKTAIHIMHPPREGKPLLVLDLDHTLLDFSSKTLQRDGSTLPGQGLAAAMKRPFMDDFLAICYQHYDLVVWSQTSWRWLETKLTELGMLTQPRYRFCFVLDKTSMFQITSKRRDGASVQHHVKPLHIIWRKFPCWDVHNTVHVDDLSRNFALNPDAGLKIKAYYRKKAPGRRDAALQGLALYLEKLVASGWKFQDVDFGEWMDVAAGAKPLRKKTDRS
jgi:ubiquitin-like domain-containing CTD phosphatase 1